MATLGLFIDCLKVECSLGCDGSGI